MSVAQESRMPPTPEPAERFLVKSPGAAPYFTTSPQDAPSLRDLLKVEAKLARTRSIELLIELCHLVNYLHQNDTVYRELRPELIKLGELISLGGLGSVLVKGAEERAPKLNRKRSIGYLAPEQLTSDMPHFEPRSDLFSLGAILYELLMGQPPFTGANHAAVLLATVEQTPAAPRSLDASCPARLSSLCMRLLSKRPEDRPTSASEVLRELEGCLEEEKGAASAPPTNAEDFRSTSLPGMKEAFESTLSISQRRGEERAAQAVPEPSASLQSFYEMTGELGKGGLGKVSKAIDKRLRRPVAVKELLQQGGASRARFLREALLTAKLQHPGVVPIYEAGLWPDGSPFYAMKLVEGKILSDLIQEKESLVERLALLPNVISACEAIAYAHSQNIIHRDIKPQNIIIGEYGETIVIDWGLAKDLSEEEPLEATEELYRSSGRSQEGLTATGAVLGTPAYMPTEQAQGKSVDKRADVYALGALLYHLLSGEPPYRAERSRSVLLKVLSSPPVPLREREPGTPADLLAIVEKAMARTPQERYQTAGELLDDLKKFQTGQLVGAYQYSRAELIRRFLRRHKTTLGITGILLGLLFGVGLYSLLAVTSAYSREALARRQEAERADQLALTSAKELLQSDPERVFSVLSALSGGFSKWGAARLLAADALSRPKPQIFQGHRNVGAFGDFSVALSQDGRFLASADQENTIHLWDLQSGAHQRLLGHTNAVTALVFSPLGDLLASSSVDHTARLWTLNGGQSRALPEHDAQLSTLDFSPDGRYLADVSKDRAVRLWDLTAKEGTPRQLRHAQGEILWLRFSPDGGSIAFAEVDLGVRLLDLKTGEDRLLSEHPESVMGASFSPDGSLLVASSFWDKALRVWSLTGGEATKTAPTASYTEESPSQAFAFSPDGKLLAYGTDGGLIKLREIAAGSERVLSGHQGAISFVAFSQDGTHLATGGADKSVRVWELSTGKGVAFIGHKAPPTWGRFLPDGKSLLTASNDDTVRRWSLTTQERLLLKADCNYPDGLPRLDSRDFIACGASNHAVKLVSLKTAEILSLEGHTEEISAWLVSPSRLVSGSHDHSIRVWTLPGKETAKQSPTPLQVLKGHQGYISVMAISPNERYLASGSADKTLRFWDLETGQGHLLMEYHTELFSISFSPDGRYLAASDASNKLVLFRLDPTTGGPTLLQELEGYEPIFSPDSDTLIAAIPGKKIILWHIETGASITVDGPTDTVLGLRCSPDGSLLAVISSDSSVGLYSLQEKGKLLWSHTEHFDAVRDAAFSPDGKTLATGSRDGTLRLWDVETGGSRALYGHKGRVYAVSFSQDGDSIATVGEDGSIRLWDDSLPRDPEALRAWLNEQK